MRLIILFITVVSVYLLLRSEGGEGFTIRFAVPPRGTAEGRRVRIKLFLTMLIALSGLSLTVVYSKPDRESAIRLLLESFALGALATYIRGRR